MKINKAQKKQLGMWLAGIALLMGLNMARDIRIAHKKYEWEPVASKMLRRGVSTSGVMEALRVAEIKSQVEESVDKKMVNEGDVIKKDQPLVQLTRSHTQLEFEQKRNSHLSIQADYKKAVRELSVQRKLLKNLAVSKQQVEDAEQAVGKTKAAMEISAQELALVQQKLDSTLVRSPIDGVVLKDFTKLGQSLTIGKEIITVGDVSKFIVRAKVDELDIEQISLNQMVDITADAFPGKVMKGKVASIASQAERETFAKVEVVVDITDNSGLTLKHNLSVRVNIVTEDLPSSLSVPIKCVVKKEGDDGWVMVKTRLGLVRERRIKLGKLAGDRIQVLSGLKPGEEVGADKFDETAS